MRSKALHRAASAGLAVLLAGAAGCAPAERPEDPMVRHPGADVLAAGSDLVVTDSVAGDAMLAGGAVSFDGFTGGSYLGVGGEQRLGGYVEGSVRALGGAVEVDGYVRRNVMLAGGLARVARNAQVDGSVYVAARRAEIEGPVAGDLLVAADEVVLDGEVGGDVRVEARSLTLGPAARIAGDLRYRVEVDGAPATPHESVEGNVEALAPWDSDRVRLLPWAFRVVAFVLSGLVVVALLPGPMARAADTMERRAPAAAGVGLLWVVIAPVALAVLAATVVGLPLALVGAALYAGSLYLAPVVPAVWVGRELLTRDDRSTGRRVGIFRFVGGALIVAFAILLPWVGFLARLVAIVLGVGAVALTLRSAPAA